MNKPENMCLVERIRKTLVIPADRDSRDMLLAFRCGFLEGSLKLAGFDNRFTQWCWKMYLRFHPELAPGVEKVIRSFAKNPNVFFWEFSPN